MDSAIDLILIAAWVSLGALLAYHVFDSWRHPEAAPFFQMLARSGLSPAQVDKATLAAALRRCELCVDRKACVRALAVDWLGKGPLACAPNARFLAQLKHA